jgi:hypothetical protein
VPDTELLTAAKTTLANDIPEVEPKNLGSLAPWTDTMPILETNLVSFSLSYFSFSSFERLSGERGAPFRYWAGVGGGGRMGLLGPEPFGEGLAGVKCSGGAKAIEFSARSASRYKTRVSK